MQPFYELTDEPAVAIYEYQPTANPRTSDRKRTREAVREAPVAIPCLNAEVRAVLAEKQAALVELLQMQGLLKVRQFGDYVYEGELQGTVPHGIGRMYKSDGSLFVAGTVRAARRSLLRGRAGRQPRALRPRPLRQPAADLRGRLQGQPVQREGSERSERQRAHSYRSAVTSKLIKFDRIHDYISQNLSFIFAGSGWLSSAVNV
jgi:hypothetical protein